MEVKTLKNKKILVTGGTGFVGSHVIERLIEEKAVITTICLSLKPHSYFVTQKLHKKVLVKKVDVRDYLRLQKLIKDQKIDFIIHLAAEAIVDRAYSNPLATFSTNIMGTVNILECARMSKKIKGVIVASSDKAYGKLAKQKYTESDPLRGDHPYEVSKSSADLICRSYFKTYNVPVCVTRFGNIYGEGDRNYSRIVPSIARSLITGSSLQIRSNGKYVRDYLYVKDVAEGYVLLLKNIEKLHGEAFNFGSPDRFSVLDLVGLFQKILKKKVPYKILNTAKNEIVYQSLDYHKIKRAIGWVPHYRMRTVLENVYQWYSHSVAYEIK